MATHIVAQIITRMDSSLPRDGLVNVVHFNHSLELIEGAPEYGDLATDLAAAWDLAWAGKHPQIDVKMYNAADPPGTPPRGEHTVNNLAYPGSDIPREIALCLSFHDGLNRPRHRGRIFLPMSARTPASGLGVRPTAQQTNDAMAVAANLAGLGGTNVDWCVYSKIDSAMRPVKHAWCDDEWDVQRRRGLRATRRDEVALDE